MLRIMNSPQILLEDIPPAAPAVSTLDPWLAIALHATRPASGPVPAGHPLHSEGTDEEVVNG